MLYDIIRYLGGELSKGIEVVKRDLLEKQILNQPIITDEKVLRERKENEWLYSDEKRKQYIQDIIKTRGIFKVIDLSFLRPKQKWYASPGFG